MRDFASMLVMDSLVTSLLKCKLPGNITYNALTSLYWLALMNLSGVFLRTTFEKEEGSVGNHSKHGKCGSAPTWKSQWGARFAGRTHVHGSVLQWEIRPALYPDCHETCSC